LIADITPVVIVRKRSCPDELVCLPGVGTRSIPNLQLNLLAVHIYGPDLEVYAYGSDEGRRKLVFTEA
jgi:hypothetical protein